MTRVHVWEARDLLGGVVRPDKLLSRAEALVPQGHGRVDDVLPVAAHHHEPGGEGENAALKTR